MRAGLDHLVVVVGSLAEATQAFAAAGFTVSPGGRHVELPTENALVCFADGSYLELLATREATTRHELQAAFGTPRWARHLNGVSAVSRRFLPLLAGPDGVCDWVLRAGSLARSAAALRSHGLVAAGPVAMGRERTDGVKLEWELLLPESFLHPFVIRDKTARALRVPGDASATTHANGARGVCEVVVAAEVPPMAALELADVLGTVPRSGPDGTTHIACEGFHVRIEAGPREGACAARIAGLDGLPPDLRALGLAVE
jgi:hypothetical protein